MTARVDSLLTILGSSMGARLAMAVLNYGLFWSLSHRLSSDALGGFSLLMNIFFLVQALPLLGLSSVVMRRTATLAGDAQARHLALADPEAAVRREYATALVFALPFGALIGAAIAAAGHFGYPASLHAAFNLLALALLPTAAILVIECVLLGRERMAVVARVQAVEALGRTVLGVAAVHQGWGLAGVFAVFAALRLVCLLTYLWRGGLPWPSLAAFDRVLWRHHWRDVPVFFAIVLLAAVASRIDMVLLSRLRSMHDVGLYAAAARLYDAALMLPTVAAMVVMPALARSYQSDRQRFYDTLAAAVRVGLMLGVVPALGVAALAEPLIGLLYAPSLADAAGVLRWLIFGAVLMTLDQMLSSTMMAASAQAEDLRTMVIAVAVLLLGLLVLVPLQGPQGAAMAVLLALLARVGWRLRWAVQVQGVHRLVPDLWRLALAIAAGVAALWLGLQVQPLAGAGAALGAYGLALWLTGLIGPHSPAQFWQACRQLRGRGQPLKT